MAYDDLRQWIKALDKAGELKRVREEVDPILEIAEITDRASKAGKRGGKPGGPALLFERVKGYPGTAVLMNQFGSERRMKLALPGLALAESLYVALQAQGHGRRGTQALVLALAELSKSDWPPRPGS